MNEILKMNSRSPNAMMKFVSIFLCCVTLFALVDKRTLGFDMAGTIQEQENKRSTLFYKVKEGKALSGHVISVHQASSEIACTHKCLSNPQCASFNFEVQQSRSLSTCELNAVSRTSANSKLKSRDGFAYYEPLTPASRVPSTQPATTAVPVSNCGQHWHAYRSGCLRLFEDHKNWVDANQHCATFSTPGKGNGTLISIFSQVDNNRIGNLRSSQGFSEGEYCIGLNDLQGTGTYKWVDGTAASFTNWDTDYSKGGKVAVVMKMNGNSDNGKWQTKNIYNAMRFICECPEGPCASQ